MKRIPDSQKVTKALREATKAVKKSLHGLNQQAGQQMARGDYTGAEELAGKGREIHAFLSQIESIQKDWMGIRNSGNKDQTGQKTPLWAYYQPILKVLIDLGGKGNRAEIELRLEKLMKNDLQSGDYEAMANGRMRWQVMVIRARKHLVKEGWLENKPSQIWRITSDGRHAAKGKNLKS